VVQDFSYCSISSVPLTVLSPPDADIEVVGVDSEALSCHVERHPPVRTAVEFDCATGHLDLTDCECAFECPGEQDGSNRTPVSSSCLPDVGEADFGNGSYRNVVQITF
jgi:hypothetical protein